MPNARILNSTDAAAKRWLDLVRAEWRHFLPTLGRNDERAMRRWKARLAAANRAYRVWVRRDAARTYVSR